MDFGGRGQSGEEDSSLNLSGDQFRRRSHNSEVSGMGMEISNSFNFSGSNLPTPQPFSAISPRFQTPNSNSNSKIQDAQTFPDLFFGPPDVGSSSFQPGQPGQNHGAFPIDFPPEPVFPGGEGVAGFGSGETGPELVNWLHFASLEGGLPILDQMNALLGDGHETPPEHGGERGRGDVEGRESSQ